MIAYFTEVFNKIITLFSSFSFMEYVNIYNALIGAGIITSIISNIKLLKDRKRIGRSRRILEKDNKLLREKNRLLEDNEEKYESILKKRNEEFDLFVSCIPYDEDSQHALMHELVELSEKAEKTIAHNIRYNGEIPKSRLFLNSACIFLSNFLMRKPKMYCARNLISQKLLNDASNFAARYEGVTQNFFGEIKNDKDDIIDKIDLMWNMCKDTKENHSKDMIICAKAIMSASEKVDTKERERLINEAFSSYDTITDNSEEDEFDILPNMMILRILLSTKELREEVEDDAIFKRVIEKQIEKHGVLIDVNIKNRAINQYNLFPGKGISQ